MTLINALLLSSVAPFVFVMDMDLRRRPIIGLLVRLSGALFRDRRRYRDVSRINFVIGRALKRRQVVVIFRSCEWQPEPAASGFPSALLQSAADACCTLTAAATSIKSAAATCPQRSGARHPVAEILMQRRSLVTIAFHPPAFHHGNRKQLAAQLWREVRVLERTGTVTAQSRRCGATRCDN